MIVFMAKKSIAKPTPIILASKGDKAVPLGAAGNGTRMGEPVKMFRKDILHVGRLNHPVDGWDEEFTPERLTAIANETNKLIAAGFKPHLPEDHQRYAKAAGNRGWVHKLELIDDVLYADVELIGKDGLLAAARNNVSVFIEPQYKDSKGNVYGEVLTHLCLTPVPVQGDQGEFMPIAASATGTEKINVPVLSLAMEGTEQDEEIEMPKLLEALAKRTGKTIKSDDEAILAFDAYVADLEAKAKPGAIPTPEAIAASLAGSIDTDMLEQIREAREAGFDSLVTAGNITPAVCKELKAMFCGARGKPSVLTLSTKVSKGLGGGIPMADAVVEILKKNKPADLGVKTGSQRIAASRVSPGSEGASPDLDEHVAGIIEAANKGKATAGAFAL